MVVRDKQGRKRYILFIIKGMGKDAIINALSGCDISLKLILYNGTCGIVRCRHIDQDIAIEWLNSLIILGRPVRTLKTSGTLRTLKYNLISVGFGET